MEFASDAAQVLDDAAVAVGEFAEDILSKERVEEAVGDLTSQAPEEEQEQKFEELSGNNLSVLGTQSPEKFSLSRFLGSLSINLILPFINGLMLGFGEIIAHEIGFRYNWVGAKIYRPSSTREQKTKLL